MEDRAMDEHQHDHDHDHDHDHEHDHDHDAHQHSAEEGHFEDDPPLREDPSAHPTTRDAGVSDAARAVRADDPLENPGVRRDGFTETGAASGKVAMRDGEEPVAGDEDREEADRTA
jgi:hypothetical protein